MWCIIKLVMVKADWNLICKAWLWNTLYITASLWDKLLYLLLWSMKVELKDANQSQFSFITESMLSAFALLRLSLAVSFLIQSARGWCRTTWVCKESLSRQNQNYSITPCFHSYPLRTQVFMTLSCEYEDRWQPVGRNVQSIWPVALRTLRLYHWSRELIWKL